MENRGENGGELCRQRKKRANMATRLGMGRSAVKFERLSGCGHPGGWRRSDVAVAGGRSGGGCSGDESRFGRSLNRRIGHPLSGRVEPLDLIRSGWKLG